MLALNACQKTPSGVLLRRVFLSAMTKPLPTCANCKVVMNLCHCSSSSCGSCALPRTGEGPCCECVLTKPKPCKACAEHERAAQEAASGRAEAEKKLQVREREFTDLRRKLGEAKSAALAERDKRGEEERANREKIEKLQADLLATAAAAQPVTSAERVAELERAAHLAVNMEAAAEAKRKSAEQALAKAREEASELRERTHRAEQRARECDEAERERGAHEHAAADELRDLQRRLEASEGARAKLAAEAEAAGAARAEAAAAHAARAELKEEVTRLKAQVQLHREHSLAYDGAVAEGRKLKGQLEAAHAEAQTQRARAEEERARAETERARADELAKERVQLESSLAHAEKVRALFASVTSRTNQVQEAANSVIATVEARRKAERKGEAEQPRSPAEEGAARERSPAERAQPANRPPRTAEHAPSAPAPRRATTSAGSDGGRGDGAPPIKPREGWAASGGSLSARGPLQAKQLAAAAHGGNVPWPPQPPPGERKGLPAGRPGARAVLTPR
jgi:hypothetical protein